MATESGSAGRRFFDGHAVGKLSRYRLLGDRARLRKGAWDAIESLMQRDGAALMSGVQDN